MKKIAIIAFNTYKEAIRDKLLYNLLIFALLLIGCSVILSSLTIGERSKIIIDISLASINLFGVLIAVFVGIGLVSKEIEKKTIFTLLSKPVHRWQFLMGKYFGLLFTLAVNIVLMTFGLYLVQFWGEWAFQIDLLKAIWLIFVELSVVTAFALFFSTFTTSSLAAIFSLSLYVIGHLTDDLREFSTRLGDKLTESLGSFLYYVLPNLEIFNIKSKVVHGLDIPISYIGLSTLYGLLYITVVLLLASAIFQQRDFK